MTGERDDHFQELIVELGRALTLRQGMLATAESCTGGLIGHLATNISGSSQWFAGGVIAYSNQVKESLLGVSANDIAVHGAVSEEVVLAMAVGAQGLLRAQAALAVSGIAGPDGGTPEKPVGTVWIAWAYSDTRRAECFHFSGSRWEIKIQTAEAALRGMLDLLQRN